MPRQGRWRSYFKGKKERESRQTNSINKKKKKMKENNQKTAGKEEG